MAVRVGEDVIGFAVHEFATAKVGQRVGRECRQVERIDRLRLTRGILSWLQYVYKELGKGRHTHFGATICYHYLASLPNGPEASLHYRTTRSHLSRHPCSHAH